MQSAQRMDESVKPSEKVRILFVCTGNIARSQIAEGLARSMAADRAEIVSAGSHPHPMGVHPLAVRVLSEIGIDIAHHVPKKIDPALGEFDYVITLCDDAAQECPNLPARREREHWSIPDPVFAGADPVAKHEFFREIRNDVSQRIREFLRARNLLR